MSNFGKIIIVVLSLIMGFAGGFVYSATLGKSKTATSTTTQSTASKNSATSQKSLADCLKEVWGDDKYAAISVNSSLATTEDNLTALKCYE